MTSHERKIVACMSCGVTDPTRVRWLVEGGGVRTRRTCKGCGRVWESTRPSPGFPDLVAVDPLVVTDPRLAPTAVRLYVILCAYEQNARVTGLWPDQDLLAAELGRSSHTTLRRVVKELVTAGVITVKRGWSQEGRGAAHRYRIHDRATRDRERHSSNGASRRREGRE